jgi:ribosomal protein L12E/L44/L45/RPP1/RPP2
VKILSIDEFLAAPDHVSFAPAPAPAPEAAPQKSAAPEKAEEEQLELF